MKQKRKLVNWQDSMKISAAHLRQTEDFFIEAMSDTASVSLTNYNYGLLPQNEAYDGGIRIREHVTDHIEIILSGCNAITPSGIRIDFSPTKDEEPLRKTYSPQADRGAIAKNTTHWDIIVVVDPYNRVAVGELNPDEVPPRHPDCEKKYALYVMPKGEINTSEVGSHYLTIGRIRKEGDRYVVDHNYIPPCTSMVSHGDLSQYYERFAECFQGLEKSSRNIIEKIHNTSNSTSLAANIKLMCEDVLRYIASIYFNFRNKGRFMAPIYCADYISSLAHICYVDLIFMKGKHKDELLQYFYEWSDVTPGSFEELLAESLELVYDHDNIRSMMVRSEHFLETLCELWDKLSRLEYVGQHKESIVVSERGRTK